MILEWDKWGPIFKRNVPVAILFFILGAIAFYVVVFNLVLESKNAQIEILSSKLENTKNDTNNLSDAKVQTEQLKIRAARLEEEKADLANKLKTALEEYAHHPAQHDFDKLSSENNLLKQEDTKQKQEIDSLKKKIAKQIKEVANSESLKSENDLLKQKDTMQKQEVDSLKKKIAEQTKEIANSESLKNKLDNGAEFEIKRGGGWASPDGVVAFGLQHAYESQTGPRAVVSKPDGELENIPTGKKYKFSGNGCSYILVITYINTKEQSVKINVTRESSNKANLVDAK